MSLVRIHARYIHFASMRAVVLLAVIVAIAAISATMAVPTPPMFPPRGLSSSIFQCAKPFDAIWGNMLQIWDFQKSSVTEKIFFASNMPDLPNVVEYNTIQNGQVRFPLSFNAFRRI